MSNSFPRTMRRNAAMSGSTSTKSGSKVLGFTVPSLNALLLPCVRVTVFSFGPAMFSSPQQKTDDGDRSVVRRAAFRRCIKSDSRVRNAELGRQERVLGGFLECLRRLQNDRN